MRRTIPLFLLAAVIVPLLAGCRSEEEQAPDPVRPVRTVTVSETTAGEPLSLSGTVQAVNEVSAAFRIAGRVIERAVNVGDRVSPGQVLARLDSQNELNALKSAEAGEAAAEGQLVQARNSFGRQESLLRSGFTTKANHDQARQALQTAQSRLDDARAQLRIARDRVDFTELRADAAGTVTARGAEAGEVVQPGQMIVQIAREGGRDAVFDVPAQLIRQMPSDPAVSVALTDAPDVTARGRVREVSPQADPVTRTFRVRVGLIDPPEAMRLGSTVRGTATTESLPRITLAASALTSSEGRPAVWVVDPQALTVALRPVELAGFGVATATISEGLAPGDIVVTAGVQALHPGQQVRLLEAGR
jgi:RND family efflux transporter MFP subunit